MLRLLGIALALGTAALVAAGVAVLLVAVVCGWPRLARVTGFGLAAWLLVYAALIAASPRLYPPRVVPLGAERAFCDIDCHLRLAVTEVRVERRGGRALWHVGLRVRSDARVEPQLPSALTYQVRDERGRLYEALPPNDRGRGSGPFASPVEPGGSYERTITLALPAEVRAPRLVAYRPTAVDRLIPFEQNLRVQRGITLALTPAAVQH